MRVFSLLADHIVLFLISICINIASAEQGTSPKITIVPNVGHIFGPGTLAFAADQKILLSAGVDATKLWDVTAGRLIRSFPASKTAALSKDAKTLLTGGKDGFVMIWDATSGELLHQFNVNSKVVQFVAFLPDERAALSADNESLKILDVHSGNVALSIPLSYPDAFALSPDGHFAATGHFDKNAKLWDLRSGELTQTFSGHSALIVDVAFSPDGKMLATRSADGTLGIWDVASGRQLKRFNLSQPDIDTIGRVAFSPDGHVVAAGDHGELKLWDVRSGEALKTLSHTGSFLISIAFLPDGEKLIWSTTRNDIQLIDLRSGAVLQSFSGQSQGVSSLAFSPNGQKLIAGAGRRPRVWDARTGRLLQELSGHAGPVSSVAFSHDGKNILTGSSDKTIKLWEASSGALIRTFETKAGVRSAAFSPDGRTILSSSFEVMLPSDITKRTGDRELRLWDVGTGLQIGSFAETYFQTTGVYSPDGSAVLSGSSSSGLPDLMSKEKDSSLKVWDIRSRKLQRRLTNPNWTKGAHWVGSLAISPDGREALALTGFSGSPPLELWNLAKGESIRTFNVPGVISTISFVRGGRVASIVTDDRVVWLDLTTGNVLKTFSGNIGSLSSATISPDGRILAAAGKGGISFWDTNRAELLAVSVVSSESDDWVTITPEGFFDASSNGAKLLSVVRGLQVLGIEQIYQSLYRPDLVREKLLGDPRGLVREAAAQLDLNRVIASGSAPDVKLILQGRVLGAGSVDGERVAAVTEISDRGGGIGRLEWRVNGVTAAIDTPIASGGSQPVRLTRNITLDPGGNTIEVTAYNAANLIASVPALMNVQAQVVAPSAVPSPAPSTPLAPVAAAKPSLFVLVAGVNEYADQRFKLSYAVSDAKEVARAFREASGDLYRSAEVRLMTDVEVTRDKLDAAFRDIASKTSTSDVFVLYLAGHGKTIDGRYYFVPQDFLIEGELSEKRIDNAVRTKAIAQDQWQKWFASMPARKSVILFDTCDSGTIVGDETQQIEKGAANDRIAQATGRSILAASGGSQEALEGYHGHGLFTYEVLDAINQADGDRSGTVELNELAAYVYAQVAELSQRVFKQRQVPQMKITANYPLAKQTRILQDETTPVAEGKPNYQVSQTAQLQVQPGSGATVVRSLSARSAVTVLESKDGWSLVAADGKPLGYVATRDLAPVP